MFPLSLNKHMQTTPLVSHFGFLIKDRQNATETMRPSQELHCFYIAPGAATAQQLILFN